MITATTTTTTSCVLGTHNDTTLVAVHGTCHHRALI